MLEPNPVSANTNTVVPYCNNNAGNKIIYTTGLGEDSISQEGVIDIQPTAQTMNGVKRTWLCVKNIFSQNEDTQPFLYCYTTVGSVRISTKYPPPPPPHTHTHKHTHSHMAETCDLRATFERPENLPGSLVVAPNPEIGLDWSCLTTTHVLQDILAVLHKWMCLKIAFIL